MDKVVTIRGSGKYYIDTSKITASNITLNIGGQIGDATINIDGRILTVWANVYDGGPITSSTVDDIGGRQAQRIIIDGRADELCLNVTVPVDGENPILDLAVK